MNQQPMQTPGQQQGGQMEEPKKSSMWLWITLVVVIVAAVAVWFFYIK